MAIWTVTLGFNQHYWVDYGWFSWKNRIHLNFLSVDS